MAEKSELARFIESLQIMAKYDKGQAYIEISGEESFSPAEIDPTTMTVDDRKAILNLGVFSIVAYDNGGEMSWNTQSQREDGDMWTYDENLNILTQGA